MILGIIKTFYHEWNKSALCRKDSFQSKWLDLSHMDDFENYKKPLIINETNQLPAERIVFSGNDLPMWSTLTAVKIYGYHIFYEN